MTDTEDPNIATLREALMEAGGRQRAYAALPALNGGDDNG